VKYTRKAARAAGKPVIALKLGAFEGGRAAAKAHTGGADPAEAGHSSVRDSDRIIEMARDPERPAAEKLGL
jgi:acetyltransferase